MALLSPEFMARLDTLQVGMRKVLAGRFRGEKRSRRRGRSIEFADHREYAYGDDIRFLDWHLYARLDRLFLKLFLDEEDLHVYLLIDASRSMEFGRTLSIHLKSNPWPGSRGKRLLGALTSSCLPW